MPGLIGKDHTTGQYFESNPVGIEFMNFFDNRTKTVAPAAISIIAIIKYRGHAANYLLSAGLSPTINEILTTEPIVAGLLFNLH
jgi:hypothetical protein